jgi:DegV family protein with EDD domain
MPKIALVTDSTCDLPEVEQARLHPVLVPLHFNLGGADYLDRMDMDYATFFQRFRESGQIARSSQPSVGEFADVYKRLLADHDAVVSVHISARLSGTIESATQAAQSVDRDRVKVIDARHVSVGLGLVVQTAGEAIATGADLDAVVAAAEAAARATRVYGALYDLEVAVRGGRVSAPAAMVAGAMRLKPLIVFSEDGAAHIAGARLGYRRALQAMADKVVRFAAGNPARVAVVHADGVEAAQLVKARLTEALGDALGGQEIPIVPAGAVITTHVGLGTVAVAVQRL